MAGETESGLIPIEQAALLLMISAERVRQLVKAGSIPKPAKGRVPLVGAVQGYIRFLKDEDRRSTKTASASRVQDARAQEIELRTAERKRELIPIEEATAALDFVVAKVRGEMTGLPIRFTRDVPLRRKLEDELNGALRRATEALRKASDDVRSGRDPFGAVSED
jgi:hypothetical protein